MSRTAMENASNTLAIATIALARQQQEENALLEALSELARLHVPIFATDGGSGAAFLEHARRIEGVTFCEPAVGLWAQVRRGLEAARAAGAKWIFYTEPDKRDFFRENLARFLDEAALDERTGIVLVARDARTMATFPPFQQYTESAINHCCAEVMGETFDYSYGPFILASSVVPHLMSANEDIAWGWRPFAFGIAHRLGLSIKQVLAASPCPADPCADAERVYRMQQLAESVRGLVLSTKVPL